MSGRRPAVAEIRQVALLGGSEMQVAYLHNGDRGAAGGLATTVVVGRRHAAAPAGVGDGARPSGVPAQAGLRMDAKPTQSATEPKAKQPRMVNIGP